MGLEVSLIFAFLAMLCWAFGDFFIQKCTRKIGDIECLAFIGIIGSIMVFPFAVKDFHLLFSLQNLFLLVIFSVITFIAAVFDFEALKKGKISVVDVVLEIELPVTIILGIFLFGESLSLGQMGVISLIFVGIILIAIKSFSHFKGKLEKGVFLTFLAAIFMGVVNISMAYSGRNISPLITIWSIWFITGIFSIIFLIKKRTLIKTAKDSRKYWKIILTMGIFDTLAWLFFVFATLKSEISVIIAITESYPALAIFLGVWFNHEKINWHQYVGAALALGASITLAFFI